MARDNDGDGSPLARAARRIGRPSKTIDMPGMPGERVAIWAPNEDEESRADVAARQRLTKEFKLSALDLSLAQETELVRRERELELLASVLRDPSEPSQAYTESSDELREAISGQQRQALIESIEDFKRERFVTRTPDEDADLVRVLRDMGKVDGVLSTYLTSCDAATLRRMVVCLATSTPQTPPNSSKT